MVLSATLLCVQAMVAAQPQPLPAGHNGGVAERLLPRPVGGGAAARRRPHVLFILWDDYGWAGAGFHRPVPTPEVQTPTMDSLVRVGLEFTNSYVFYCCSPTRSAIQSGRNPIHVNVVNADPNIYNESDPVSGAAGIARNFTGVATKMAAAGCALIHLVPLLKSKWSCADPDLLTTDSCGASRLDTLCRQVGCRNGLAGPHAPRTRISHIP
jgi:hypothetical protein